MDETKQQILLLIEQRVMEALGDEDCLDVRRLFVEDNRSETGALSIDVTLQRGDVVYELDLTLRLERRFTRRRKRCIG